MGGRWREFPRPRGGGTSGYFRSVTDKLSARELRQLAQAVEAIPRPWPKWPGGWPNEIEAALIDPVFGIWARYGKPGSGVRRVVGRWRDHLNAPLDDLRFLADTPSADLAAVLVNRHKVRGRPKAALVQSAAEALIANIRSASDALRSPDDAAEAYRSVAGLGASCMGGSRATCWSCGSRNRRRPGRSRAGYEFDRPRLRNLVPCTAAAAQ